MMTRRILLIFALAAAAAAQQPSALQSEPQSAPQSAPGGAQEPAAGTLTVNVKLVNIFATVLDQHGAPVGGLSKDAFQLFEDGHQENIAVFERESELPLSIVLAVDTSLSTRKDIHLELQSARQFAHRILRPVDRMSLYQFSEIVDELVPFTNDLKAIDRGIDRVRIGAATALYDVVYLGAESLAGRKGRKVMVVITDGGDTASKVNYPAALRSALGAEAIVYSIIVVPIEASAGRNTGGEHALIQLAHDTGGKFFYAENGARLDQAFRKIDDELRTQYLLAYYPSRRVSDSDFRRIEITVAPPAGNAGETLTTRHRAGYFTAPSR